jgi:hypothetical protein
LGHVAAEWDGDALADNVVPESAFSVPPVIVGGCSNFLETGDPLENPVGGLRAPLELYWHFHDVLESLFLTKMRGRTNGPEPPAPVLLCPA